MRRGSCAIEGKFWHVRYPLEDGGRAIVVATTRPETLLADMAVAVHPDDERYRYLVGRHVRLPITGRIVPIVADEHAPQRPAEPQVVLVQALLLLASEFARAGRPLAGAVAVPRGVRREHDPPSVHECDAKRFLAADAQRAAA